MAGRHSLYGNQHGLPGLPKTSYITRKPVRQPPRVPPPQPTPRRPPPRPVTQRAPPPPQQMLPQPPIMPAGPDPFVTRRMDMLEQRLNSSEQSNRTLMDELMRLQTDMKMQIKKNEMSISEERESKGRVEVAMRQSQGHQYEMEDRVRRCEEGIKENKQIVQQLSGHMQSVEKLVSSIQIETNEKNSQGNNKMNEYRQDLLKLGQETEQIDRYCTSLKEDNRMLQNSLDTVKTEMSSMQRNVKLQARLLEENAKMPKTPLLKPKEDSMRMQDTEKMVIEGKMISLNNTIQELNERMNNEAKKREKLINDINSRLNEMNDDYGKTQLEKDKELKQMTDELQELQSGFSAAEKQKILNEINNVANELQRKMDEKEAKLRKDTVNKLTVIESTLVSENERREEQERALNEKIDNQLKTMTSIGDESSSDLKSVFDKHESETRDRIGDVTFRMNNVEEALRKHKLENERVLTAEINERENMDKRTESKLQSEVERLELEIKKSEVNLAEFMSSQSHADKDDEKSSAASAAAFKESQQRMEELRKLQEEQNQRMEEELADELSKLDGRLVDVETSVKQHDEKLESTIKAARDDEKEAKEIMGDKLTNQIEAIQFRQNKLEKNVKDLREQVEDTPKDIQLVKDQMEEAERKMKSKIEYEAKERVENDEELKDDIDKILGRRDTMVPSLAQVQSDVEATQTGMKKLAEAVHVVKSSLMERIKDEKKLREKETVILKRDVERLDSKYHDIKEQIKTADYDNEEDYNY